jgi:purine-binding chemotaxis protein CheW
MEKLLEKSEKISMANFDDEDDTLKDKFLTFNIADEFYAIEIQYVIEIIGMQKITKIPNVKKYINGIINLRGNIIPVVEVRTRFGMNRIPYNDRTCIIVVNINEMSIGLIVDEVSEVVIIAEEHVSNPPSTNKGTHSRFIQGIGTIDENVKIILIIHKLLYDDALHPDLSELTN